MPYDKIKFVPVSFKKMGKPGHNVPSWVVDDAINNSHFSEISRGCIVYVTFHVTHCVSVVVSAIVSGGHSVAKVITSHIDKDYLKHFRGPKG